MIAMWWEDISEYILTRTLEFMLEPLDQPVNLLLYQELQQDVCTEWHKAHYALKSAMLQQEEDELFKLRPEAQRYVGPSWCVSSSILQHLLELGLWI